MFVVFEDHAGNKVTIDNAASSDSLATLLNRLNELQPDAFKVLEKDLKPNGLRIRESTASHHQDSCQSFSSASLIDSIASIELHIKCSSSLKGPKEAVAVLFAGQGTDVAKTIKKLSAPTNEGPWAEKSTEFFKVASEALGYDLIEMCNNKSHLLKMTEYSQPAIFVASLANMEKYKLENSTKAQNITHAAGFSLGEYAALVHAGAITLKDGISIIKVRAKAMQVAAERSAGSMVTVIGLDDTKLEQLCAEAEAAVPRNDKDGHKRLVIANHLFPKGRVLSGDKMLVAWVAQNATGRGAQIANELAVAGAFHSPYMNPALASLENILENTIIKEPNMPVYSNVTGQKYETAAEIKQLLIKQLEAPVQWEQTIKTMLKDDGVVSFVDAGPGQQLKSMMRRIDAKAFRKTVVLDGK